MSQSYNDFKRYLEATGKLKNIEDDCFELKNSILVPHQGESLFDDLPVAIGSFDEEEDNVVYGISHKDGNLYIQTFKVLRSLVKSGKVHPEISDDNYLFPISSFVNIKKVVKNPNENKFVHLHVHSEFSSSDGMMRTEDCARRCKQLGIPAVALTDHGNMAGAIEFYKSCKKYGVKPIIGQEFYLDEDRFQKGVPSEFLKSMGKKKDRSLVKIYEKEHRINLKRHLVLLAKNEKGLKNLYKLSSLAYLEGFYYRPRIDWDLLRKYSEGLIATTACLGGIIAAEDNEKQREINLRKLVEIFGKDNVYLETMLIDHEDQPKTNDIIFGLSEKYNIASIVTTDAHYLDPDPEHLHHTYMKIGSGYTYGEGDNCLKTYSELKDTFKKIYSNCKYGWSYYDKAIRNTFDIADKCNVELTLGRLKLPNFNLKEVLDYKGDKTNEGYFKRRIIEGWKNKVLPIIDKKDVDVYRKRLLYETKTIIEAGYVNYILIVLDFIENQRKLDQYCDVRGSAAGSLVCYCLDMTKVNPIERGLMFERFISAVRTGKEDISYQSYPDIDCDFEDRGKAINWLIKKYGEENVARIGTYNRLKLRSAIKGIADITGFMTKTEANKLTRSFSDSATTFETATDDPNFKGWYNVKRNKKWFDKNVKPIIGLAGHGGINAAGVVISPEPVINLMPVKLQERKKEESYDEKEVRLKLTQYEGDSVEAVGLLKFDVLRVRTLKVLHHINKLVKERKGVDINFDKVNLDKDKWYKGFRDGDAVGVFQFDTPNAETLVKNVAPNNFHELMVASALTRPGTAGPGLDMEYCERKRGKSFQYDHPLLEELLNSTYGIACVGKGTKICISDRRKNISIEKLKDNKESILSYSDDIRQCSIDSYFDKVVLKNKNAKCLKITTKTKKELIVTPDHLIADFNYYKRADEFIIGENIPLVLPSRYLEIEYWDLSTDREILEAKFIGYLLANGNINSSQWNFCSKNKYVIGDFKSVLRKLFKDKIKIKKYKAIRNVTRILSVGLESRKNPATKLLVDYGLLEKGKYGAVGNLRSADKFIPRYFIENCGRKARIELIKAMYRCDGTKKFGLYSTKSKKMAEDFSDLLMSVGILSSVVYEYNCYRIWIINKREFNKITGFKVKGVFVEKFNIGHSKLIRDYCKINNISNNEFGRKFGFKFIKNLMKEKNLKRKNVIKVAKVFSDNFMNIFSESLWWDTIVKIENVYSDVYDIVNTDTGNFSANSILVHNCFQEQIMQVSHEIGGMSLFEADDLRKVMKKKDHSKMQSYQEKFVQGGVQRGCKNRKEALAIWEKIASWSRYGFNAAHAAAYSRESVLCMAMKQLCTLEFFTATLMYPKKKDYLRILYKDIKQHNITVRMPDINYSKKDFYLDKDEIIWAFTGVKNIGAPSAESIAMNAPYDSIKDLMDKTEKKIVNKRVMDALISINGFKSLGLTHKEAAIEYYKLRSDELPAKFDVDDEAYWERLFVSHMGIHNVDPYELFADELKKYGKMDTYEEYDNMNPFEDVKIAGYITDYKKINSKNGEMAFLTLEVDFEEIFIVVWNSFFSSHEICDMPDEEIIGSFVTLFGKKDIDPKGKDQIQLGKPKDDYLEILG